MSDELASVLDGGAGLATTLAASGGPIGIAAGIAAVALKAGAALARAGKDPLIEITRILSSDPATKQVHTEVKALIARLWPNQLSPTSSDASLAVEATDPYEDIDDGKEEEQPP